MKLTLSTKILLENLPMSESKSLHWLFQLVHSVKRNLFEQIEQLDLPVTPMHVRVLKIIANKPQCTAIDIAHFLDRDKAQVTRLLSTLINRNLITKEPNLKDKRSKCLRMTRDGQKIMDQILTIDRKMFEKMTKGLSEEDLARFQLVAGQMVQNLNTNSTSCEKRREGGTNEY